MNKLDWRIWLAILAVSNLHLAAMAKEPKVIKLEETIRGNQQQPKVLSIVPWQSPKAKQALPSSIVKGINKKFAPLKRQQFLRTLAIVENKKTYPKP